MKSTAFFASILGALSLMLVIAAVGTPRDLGVVSDAAAVDERSSETINACQNNKTGVLAIKKKCSKKETSVSWNVSGPAGSNGAQGAQGPQGDQGAQGIQGPSGSSANLYVKTFTLEDLNDYPGTVVSCNEGDTAISGGFNLYDVVNRTSYYGSGVVLIGSFPYSPPDQEEWNFTFYTALNSINANLFVYCMR